MMELTKEEPSIKFLSNLELNVCLQLSELALKSLNHVISPKAYISAASKLNSLPDKVEETVQAILSILLKATEQKLTSEQLSEQLKAHDASESLMKFLVQKLEENRNLLCSSLQSISIKYPQYDNLQWRFDILTHTRSIHNICDPVISLDLQIRKPDKNINSILLQSDVKTLMHVNASLEEAIQQAHCSHSKKLKNLVL